MSRSKGTFPAYSKLDIDPNVFPPGYWDSSLECKECGMLWPNTHLFMPSICCSKGTRVNEANAPDMRWPEAVYALHEKRFNELYERWNEGLSDEELASTELVEYGAPPVRPPEDRKPQPVKKSVRPYQGIGH